MIKSLKFATALLSAFPLIALAADCAPARAEKIKAEELIARHLASVGLEPSSKKLQTISHGGYVVIDLITGGTGHLEGTAAVASDGRRNSFIFNFGNANYGQERLVYDGDDVKVGYISPGSRSPLGEFIFTYKELLEEGLFGGVLTSAWSLVETEERRPRLKLKGLKKLDGESKAWELEYRRSTGGSDAKIRLYFEEGTFRHVKTTYDVTISASMGRTPQESARQFPTRINVTEEFSQFRPVEDLTLPAHWEITYNYEKTGPGQVWKWKVDLSESIPNGQVAADAFEIK